MLPFGLNNSYFNTENKSKLPRHQKSLIFECIQKPLLQDFWRCVADNCRAIVFVFRQKPQNKPPVLSSWLQNPKRQKLETSRTLFLIVPKIKNF